MIWIIIGAIAGAIVGKCLNRDSQYDIGDDIASGIMFGALFGVIITVVMTVLNVAFNWCPLETVTTTDTHEIVQISDQTYANTSGRIFLIRGNISTDLSAGFSFYQKEADGFSLKTIEAGNTTVKYTNEQPRIETTHTYCPERENSFLSIGWLWINYCPVKGGNTWNTIYVPEGSIVESFQLGGKE